MKISKVVIPVAGLGTRGLPFTKEVAKELTPVIDTPTILFIVEEAILSGIEQVVFITSRGKASLEDFFDQSPHLERWLEKRGKLELLEKIKKISQLCELITIRQKEPLGLGHAIYCARHVIKPGELFAVALGDEIFPDWEPLNHQNPALKQIVKVAEQKGSSVCGVIEVPSQEISAYGAVDLGDKRLSDGPQLVLRTVEKPKPEVAPSNYAVIGRYVFQYELFHHLKTLKPGVGGELQLTDGMDGLSRSNSLYAYQVQGVRYDMGNSFQLIKAQVEWALKREDLGARMQGYLKEISKRYS